MSPFWCCFKKNKKNTDSCDPSVDKAGTANGWVHGWMMGGWMMLKKIIKLKLEACIWQHWGWFKISQLSNFKFLKFQVIIVCILFEAQNWKKVKYVLCFRCVIYQLDKTWYLFRFLLFTGDVLKLFKPVRSYERVSDSLAWIQDICCHLLVSLRIDTVQYKYGRGKAWV